jgi:hypothetical protein
MIGGVKNFHGLALTQTRAGGSIPYRGRAETPHVYFRLYLFGLAAQLVVVTLRLKGQFDEFDPCTFTHPFA